MSSNALCLDASNNAKIPEFKSIIMFNIFAKNDSIKINLCSYKIITSICSQIQVMIFRGVCGNALIEEIYEVLLKLELKLYTCMIITQNKLEHDNSLLQILVNALLEAKLHVP